MNAKPHMIRDMGDGSLYIMAKPTGGNYLWADIDNLSRLGVTHVLSLLEPTEMLDVGLTHEQEVCRSLGVAFSNLPIRDRSVPAPMPAFLTTIDQTYRDIIGGGRVVVHCWGGVGRSGLVTASLLIRHGIAAQAAIAEVSTARGTIVPETREQRDWIVEHQDEISRFEPPLGS